MTMNLRAPGEVPAPAIPETVELVPGYGMCDTVGHHGYCWIVEPREILGRLLHGRCASCKRKGAGDE